MLILIIIYSKDKFVLAKMGRVEIGPDLSEI